MAVRWYPLPPPSNSLVSWTCTEIRVTSCKQSRLRVNYSAVRSYMVVFGVGSRRVGDGNGQDGPCSLQKSAGESCHWCATRGEKQQIIVRAQYAHGVRVAEIGEAVNLRKDMYFGNELPVASSRLPVLHNRGHGALGKIRRLSTRQAQLTKCEPLPQGMTLALTQLQVSPK